jgi:hypothetical protein
MSIIDDINKAHFGIKAIALNLILLPFWYVAIYLFNNDFYIKGDYIIIIAMCIALSMISSFFTSILYDKITSSLNKTKYNIINLMGITIMILTIWLSILIVFFYSIGFLFNIYIYFYWFLVIYSAPIILFNLFYLLFLKN